MAKDHVQSGMPPLTEGRSATHRVVICTRCRKAEQPEAPGTALIGAVRAALDTAELGHAFDVSGTDCLAGCDAPCAVAWAADGKATWLFGDIDPEADLADLIAFSKLYHDLDDGWCRAAERPGKLARTARARIPAASQGDPR